FRMSCHGITPTPTVVLLAFLPTIFSASATTETYTLSLHDALPISTRRSAFAPRDRTGTRPAARRLPCGASGGRKTPGGWSSSCRSEEHTSELQSRGHLVCRLLLEEKICNWQQPVELVRDTCLLLPQ